MFSDEEDSEIEFYDISEVKRTGKFNKKYLGMTSTLKDEEARPEELKRT